MKAVNDYATKKKGPKGKTRQSVELPDDCWESLDRACRLVSSAHGVKMSRNAMLAILVRGGIQ